MNKPDIQLNHAIDKSITGPFADPSGKSIPVAENFQSKPQHTESERRAEFARLVSQWAEGDEDEGMFIDGQFALACPVSRSSSDSKTLRAFLKRIQDVLGEIQSQLPMQKVLLDDKTTMSLTSFPKDQN